MPPRAQKHKAKQWTDPDAECIKFLRKIKGSFLPKNKSHEACYLLFDGYRGGRIFISKENESEFVRLYSMDVEKGRILPLNENRTFNCQALCFDFDGLNPNITDEEKLQIKLETVKCIEQFYDHPLSPLEKSLCWLETVDQQAPSSSYSSFDFSSSSSSLENSLSQREIMMMGDEEEEEEEKKQKASSDHTHNKKRGNMHDIFPNIIVNSQQAYSISCFLILWLQTVFPADQFTNMTGGNAWSTIVDAKIHLKQTNGLRYVGAAKLKRCCERETCEKCKGQLFLFEGRPYRLKYIVENGAYNDKKLQVMKRSIHKEILVCSIRRHDDALTPGWKLPMLPPPTQDVRHDEKEEEEEEDVQERDAKRLKTFHETKQTKKQMRNFWKSVENTLLEAKSKWVKSEASGVHSRQRDGSSLLSPNSRVWAACEKAVHAFHPFYQQRDCTITEIRKVNAAYFVQTNSRQCLNLISAVKSEHTSKKVWFVITHRGILNRCNSEGKERTEGRVGGIPCCIAMSPKTNKKHKPKKLDVETLCLLFPDAKVLNAKHQEAVIPCTEFTIGNILHGTFEETIALRRQIYVNAWCSNKQQQPNEDQEDDDDDR